MGELHSPSPFSSFPSLPHLPSFPAVETGSEVSPRKSFFEILHCCALSAFWDLHVRRPEIDLFVNSFVVRKYWKLSIWGEMPEWVGFCPPSLNVKCFSGSSLPMNDCWRVIVCYTEAHCSTQSSSELHSSSNALPCSSQMWYPLIDPSGRPASDKSFSMKKAARRLARNHGDIDAKTRLLVVSTTRKSSAQRR